MQARAFTVLAPSGAGYAVASARVTFCSFVVLSCMPDFVPECQRPYVALDVAKRAMLLEIALWFSLVF